MIKRLIIPDAPPEVDVIALVNEILNIAIRRGASDIHIEPTAHDSEVRFRVDGILQTHSHHDANVGRSAVTRLMVMAHLLTYRLDIPQEGRLRVELAAHEKSLELRLSI